MNTFDILQELIPYNQYTLVHFDSHGMPSGLHFWFHHAELVGRAKLAMTIKPPRMPYRKIYFDFDKQFVLWNDWLNPDCNMVIKTRIEENVLGTFKMGCAWARFDTRYLIKAKDSLVEVPVVWNIDTPKAEKLIDLHIVVD